MHEPIQLIWNTNITLQHINQRKENVYYGGAHCVNVKECYKTLNLMLTLDSHFFSVKIIQSNQFLMWGDGDSIHEFDLRIKFFEVVLRYIVLKKGKALIKIKVFFKNYIEKIGLVTYNYSIRKN